MASGVSAFGTVLGWNFNRILEVTNIGGPSQSMGEVEVSHHASANGFREFVSGPRSGGEITLEGNLIKTDTNGIVAMHTDEQAGTARQVYIVSPMADAVAWQCSYAYVKGFAPSFPFDGKESVSGSLILSGKPALLTTQSAGISALSGIETTGAAALTLAPAVAAGTYAYTCTVNTASTWVKVTITAASHTIWAQGTQQTSGVQSGELTLGAAGTDTVVFIMVYEASKSPRLYTITVTRP